MDGEATTGGGSLKADGMSSATTGGMAGGGEASVGISTRRTISLLLNFTIVSDETLSFFFLLYFRITVFISLQEPGFNLQEGGN